MQLSEPIDQVTGADTQDLLHVRKYGEPECFPAVAWFQWVAIGIAPYKIADTQALSCFDHTAVKLAILITYPQLSSPPIRSPTASFCVKSQHSSTYSTSSRSVWPCHHYPIMPFS